MRSRTRNHGSGLALLESSVLLVFLVPAILAGAAAIDFMQRTSGLTEVVSELTTGVDIKAYQLGTGNVSYYLHPRFPTELNPIARDPEFMSDLASYLDRAEAVLVQQAFCNGTRCDPAPYRGRYSIEVVATSVPIDGDSGAVSEARWSRAVVSDRSTPDTPTVYKRGSYLPEWRDGDRVRLSLRNKLIDLIRVQAESSASNRVAFPYAIPTALHGSQSNQYYGAWSFAGGAEIEFPRGFFRNAAVFGVVIAIDLTGTPHWRLIQKLFPGLTPYIFDLKVTGLRKIL